MNNLNNQNQTDLPPVDEDGKPTTYVSYLIIDLMFREKNQQFTTLDLTHRLAIRQQDADSICRQLADFELFNKNLKSSKYQYNLNCSDVKLQSGLEKFLAYVDLEHIPVYRILDYSPTFREPSVR